MHPIAETTVEALPKELFGNILDSLCKVSGSVGIINEKDIPVIMRFMRNFASTCKWVRECVHDNTQCFIQSLAGKFHVPSPTIAAKLNTVAARHFLWEHIKEQKYDQVYQVIQNIRLLASELLEEAKNAQLCFDVDVSQGSPNPNFYQTKQGYLLYCGSFPHFIATPLGKVEIYGGGVISSLSAYSVTEMFIKRLDALLHSVSFKNHFFETFFEIRLSESNHIRKITEEEMKPTSRSEINSKLGTKSLIVPGNFNVYQIRKVEKKNLLAGELQDEEKYLEDDLVEMLWKMLKKNFSGKNPCTIKVKEAKKPQVVEHGKQVLKRMDEVVPWAMTLVKKLLEQLSFKSNRNFFVKALEIDFYQANFLEFLNLSAEEFFEESSRIPLRAFSNPEHFLNQVVQKGILTWYRKKPRIEEIETAYKKFIDDLGKHWKHSLLKKYTNLTHKESEEDFILYLKETNGATAVFLRYLSKELGISHLMQCYSIDARNDEEGPMIYMWIKKRGFNKVIHTLQWKNFKSESGRQMDLLPKTKS